MSFKKIFSGAITISQISGLFFSCPTTQVKADKLEEDSLKKLLEVVTLNFSQVQEMKKLIKENSLDSKYVMGEGITFGELLQKIEQFLCVNLHVLKKNLKFEFNYEEYKENCAKNCKEDSYAERLNFCLEKIKNATKDNFLKGKEYDETKFLTVAAKKSLIYKEIEFFDKTVGSALKEQPNNMQSIVKSIKESFSNRLENMMRFINYYVCNDDYKIDFTSAYNKTKISDFQNVLKFLKIYSKNIEKKKEINLEFFPEIEQKMSKKGILEVENFYKAKEEEEKLKKEAERRKKEEEKLKKEAERRKKEEEEKLKKEAERRKKEEEKLKKEAERRKKEEEERLKKDAEHKRKEEEESKKEEERRKIREESLEESNILFEDSLKKLLEVVTLNFSRVQKMKKLIKEGSLDSKYVMGEGITFGELLQKIEQFLCVNLHVLKKNLKFEFNYEEYKENCAKNCKEDSYAERLNFCLEKIKNATKDNFLKGKEYEEAKFLTHAATRSQVYKRRIANFFNTVEKALKEQPGNMQSTMENIKKSFSKQLEESLNSIDWHVYNKEHGVDFSYVYNESRISYYYDVLKFLKIFSENNKGNKKINLDFFPNFDQKHVESAEEKKFYEEELKKLNTTLESKHLEMLLKDVAISFSQVQKMKKLLDEGRLDSNYTMIDKEENKQGASLTFGQILQEFEKVLCVYLDMFKTLRFEVDIGKCEDLCKKIENATRCCFLKDENLRKAKFLTNALETVFPRNRFNKKIESFYQAVEEAINWAEVEDQKNVAEIMENIKVLFPENLGKQLIDLVKFYKPDANDDNNTPDFTFIYDNAKFSYYRDVLRFLKIYSKKIGEKEGLDSESFPNLNEEMSEKKKLEMEKFYREKEQKEKDDDLKRRIRQELIANLHNANKDKAILDLQLNLFRCCKKILYINYFIDRIFFGEERKRYSELRSIKSTFDFLNKICFKVLLHYFCCYENDKIEEVAIKKLAIKNEEELSNKEFFEVVKNLSETIDKFFQICFLTLANTSDKISSVITSRIICNYLLINVKSIEILHKLENKFKNYETMYSLPLAKPLLNYLKKLGKVELFLDEELPDPNCNKDLLREELLKKLSNILPKELFGEKFNIEDKNFIIVKSAFYNFYNNTFSTQYLSMLAFIRDFLDNLRISNKSKDAPIHIDGAENIKKFFEITDFFRSYEKKYMENIKLVDGGCNIKRIDFDKILVTTIKTAINNSIDSSVLADNFKKFQKETGINNISKIDEDSYKKEYLDKAYDIKRGNLENHTVEDFNMRDSINKYLCLKEEEQKKFVFPVMDEMFSKILKNMEIEFYSENNFADSFNK